jgi:hypothetical protein
MATKKRVTTHSHSLLPEQQRFVNRVAQEKGIPYSEVIRLAVQTLAESEPQYQAWLAQAQQATEVDSEQPSEPVRSATVRQPLGHRLTMVLYGEQWELPNTSRGLRFLVEQVRQALPAGGATGKPPAWPSLGQSGGTSWTFAYTMPEAEWEVLAWLGGDNRSRGIRVALQRAVSEKGDWETAWRAGMALEEKITAVSKALAAGDALLKAQWGLANPAPHKVLAVWQDDHARFEEMYQALVGK